MKMTRTAVRSLVVLLFASVFANAQLAPEAVQAIDKSVTQFMSSRNVPGVSVAIVKDRKLVWANGYGLADLENFVPVTTETVFRSPSISITSPGLMLSECMNWESILTRPRLTSPCTASATLSFKSFLSSPTMPRHTIRC